MRAENRVPKSSVRTAPPSLAFIHATPRPLERYAAWCSDYRVPLALELSRSLGRFDIAVADSYKDGIP